MKTQTYLGYELGVYKNNVSIFDGNNLFIGSAKSVREAKQLIKKYSTQLTRRIK